MREGRLEQIGTSLDIYRRPGSTFVAGFIGATNFLDGRFKRDGGGETGGVTETKIGPILCTAGTEVRDGQMVKLAIRPENINVTGVISGKSTNARRDVNVFEGNIESLEFQGDSLVMRVRICTELLQVKSGSSQKLEVGQNISLSMHPEDCHAILP
ncbi:Spermidine/putrescine import ATP-binding protein PotA [subsurface metagenome]